MNEINPDKLLNTLERIATALEKQVDEKIVDATRLLQQG